MNDYLAGMIARSEHQHMQQSLRPVRDFDMRGQVRRSGWAARMIGAFFQSTGHTLTRIGERISREAQIGPMKPVQQPDRPLSDQC